MPTDSLSEILRNLSIWMLQIIGGLSLISFLISIARHPFASADKSKKEALRGIMVYSIVGMLVAIFGLVILFTTRNVF